MVSPVDFTVNGRVALVIGGATGIGYAIANALVRYGATVYIGGRTEDVGRRSAAELGVTYLPTDVADTTSVERTVAEVLSQSGRLDIAVNGAGARLNKPAEDTTDDEWDAVFATNLTGVFRCCRAEGRVMLEQGAGSIVNVASMSAQVVNRPQRQSAYNSSKAGVVQYTKSLAAEWGARGVRVNALSPGYTETAMTALSRAKPEIAGAWLANTPMNRFAQPDEIAGAAVFLASDASSFVTGIELVVDGGYGVW